jgi:hypothetical protein
MNTIKKSKNEGKRKFLILPAIVAVIAFIAFVAFAKEDNNRKDETPTGNIDLKLVGHWTTTRYNTNPISYNYYHWYINKDGTFNYFMVTTAEYSYKGNYSVSNGKIYFTNVLFTNSDLKINKPDSYVNYVIEPDSKGNERLKISNTGGCFMGSPSWSKAD